MNFKAIGPPGDVDETAPPDIVHSVWMLQLKLIVMAGSGSPAFFVDYSSVGLRTINLYGERRVSKVHKTIEELSNSCVVLV